MKYDRFEDLPCWKAAVQLVTGVYALTRHSTFRQRGDLADQLRRAALSVSNNIAEGFERGSTAELLAFLYIARGSAGEVRSMLHVAARLADAGLLSAQTAPRRSQGSVPNAQTSDPAAQTSELTSRIAQLRGLAESCSRQIRGWANSLQNTDIAGPRHLNDRTRRDYDRKQSLARFELENARLLHKAHPTLYGDPDAPPDQDP